MHVDKIYRMMDKKMKKKILAIHDEQEKGEDNYLEISTDYNGRRLVVCYNSIRAKKDRKDRERLLKCLEKMTDANGEVDAKKLVKNRGSKKYLLFDKNKKIAKLDKEKIVAEASWDGVSGYITNSKKPESEIIANYKRLWEIEEAFRLCKHDCE